MRPATTPHFAARPILYSVLLLGTVVGTAVYNSLWNGIFACQATGYGSESYLSYCQAGGYGDYDHGAFWFGLEPEATQAARDADVLFIGNSRTQLAFSVNETADWFSARGARYYLLGFSHHENITFEAPLLQALQPHAAVYVVNVDAFFDETMTKPAETVLNDTTARSHYESKRKWQSVHRPVCEKVPALCMDEFVIYRARATGAWQVSGGTIRREPVSYDGSLIAADTLAAYTRSAREFVASLPVDRACIILTQVPFVKTDVATAEAIADSLNMELIAPHPAALVTFDQIHLDPPSAARWSQAFFEAAGPRIDACLAAVGDRSDVQGGDGPPGR